MFNQITKKHRKIIALSVIGNALEFYDFTLYGIFAAVLAGEFFPTANPLTSLIAAFGGFAAGFVMRPLGAGFFGYLGDRFGRRKALSLSILLMGIPTFLTGLLPPYAAIGLAAPILLVCLRLLQGLSTGGEYNGAAIFALEHIQNKRPGFVGALIASAGGIGAICAMIIGAMLTQPHMPSYAWRFPFLLGGIISVIGFILRKKIDESPEFLKQAEKASPKLGPLQALKGHLKPFIAVLSFGALDGTLSYMLVGFMGVYISTFVGFTLSNALILNAFGLSVYLVFTPIMGHLLDKTSHQRFIRAMCASLILLAPVAFMLLRSGSTHLIYMGMFLFAVLLASVSGSHFAYMQQLFPTKMRYLGISLGFSIGSALFGGTAPMFLTWAVGRTGDLMVPAYFVILLALFCLATNYAKNK